MSLTKTKCEQLKVVYTKENGVVNLAQPRESQRNLDSTNLSENQEKNSRLRFLLRQERTENPVIWASILRAREILNGRGITRAKVEKLLLTAQFDGSKQNYAVERAQRIAEKTKATQKQFANDLDIAIRKAESDLYWQDEFVENAYRAFSKGGEEYGFAKQRFPEDEALKDGHKAHGNIDTVEHYVSKFSANGNEYFIRFTVPVIRNNKGVENVHFSCSATASTTPKGAGISPT